MEGYLGVQRLSRGPWQALERGVQRLLEHKGLEDVRVVGGANDKGADVVANYAGKTWVVQCKYRSGNQNWGPKLLDELKMAISHYGADVGVLACNTGFQQSLMDESKNLAQALGVRILLWDYQTLLELFRTLPNYPAARHDARDYQAEAIETANNKIMAGGSEGLILMATGLGKTRVAAGVIESWIRDHGETSQVLVLAPSLALIPQLESSLWPYLAKTVPTHVLTGAEKPEFEGGVTVATYQSMANRADDEIGKYDLVIVDEAHHAPADSVEKLLGTLKPQFLLGLTATPWRGDNRDLEDIFGPPLFSMGIVEGMMRGFLSEVDYQMFIDDVDWSWVRENSGRDITLGELNKAIFVPQRDDAIVEHLRTAIRAVNHPRTLVFCSSKVHAEIFSNLLRADGIPNFMLHSGMDRFETTRYLRQFRAGEIDTLVAVDMLNEGIDVPDVNVVVFLRVTHSRRIFVQQLGRGLRVAPGKQKVTVLDFVSDVKRIKEAIDINSQATTFAEEYPDRVVVPHDPSQTIRFSAQEPERFVAEYLRDVSDIDNDDQRITLRYPD
jgi:superfamily II DNA or RNA helicase